MVTGQDRKGPDTTFPKTNTQYEMGQGMVKSTDAGGGHNLVQIQLDPPLQAAPPAATSLLEPQFPHS